MQYHERVSGGHRIIDGEVGLPVLHGVEEIATVIELVEKEDQP